MLPFFSEVKAFLWGCKDVLLYMQNSPPQINFWTQTATVCTSKAEWRSVLSLRKLFLQIIFLLFCRLYFAFSHARTCQGSGNSLFCFLLFESSEMNSNSHQPTARMGTQSSEWQTSANFFGNNSKYFCYCNKWEHNPSQKGTV